MSLEVSSAVKNFGDNVAVNNISFSLKKPGIYGLLGTNGAGKTTTIRMILGITQMNSGSITWKDKEIKREEVNFGYLPEERGLYPKSKVYDQLMYLGKLRGMSKKDIDASITYWLDRLKVTEYKNYTPEKLSKGNQQKIQLISAVIHDPELLILDEPLSGLDPVNADLFKDVIQELISKGKYIIMSSHNMYSIESYCEDLMILKKGNTVLQGNLREIKAGYGRTRLSIHCEEDITSYIDQNNLHILEKTAQGFEIKITDENQSYVLLQQLLENNIRLFKFEIREPSLHEIFIEKAGEN